MTSGAIYPGVPDVSSLFYCRRYLAIPKSVKYAYPKSFKFYLDDQTLYFTVLHPYESPFLSEDNQVTK